LRVSREPEDDEGWNDPTAGAARPGPAVPSTLAAKPTAPRIAPPASFGPPPSLAAKPAGSKPVAPSLFSKPAGSKPAPPALTSKPATPKPAPPTLAAKPKPVAPTIASTPATPKPADKPGLPPLAPPPKLAIEPKPRMTPAPAPPRSASALGLPPPPEFLARANSAELPLENEVRDDTGLLLVPKLPSRAAVPAELAAPQLDSLELDIDASDGTGIRVEASDDLEIDAPVDLETDDGEAADASRAAADDDEDVDMEVSDDVLPRLVDPSGRLIEGAKPFPSKTPPMPSQVSTARVPVLSIPAGTASSRLRPVPFADALPSKTPRSLGLWLGVGAGVGALISIAAIVWMAMGSEPDKDATPGAPTPAATSTPSPTPEPEPAAKANEPREATPTPPVPVPEPVEPVPDAVEPNPDAPNPDAVEPNPDAVEPEPDTVEPAEPNPDAAIITVERDYSDYKAAAAEFAATGSQESLLAMATAACALGDGPRARAAFRKLVGKSLRTKAIVACRTSRVDVSSTVDGYTGPELLAQARAALADGDAKIAYDKAHASNKVERSSEAVLLKGLAACKLGDGEQSERLLPHVSIKDRPKLRDGCKAAGVELRE
jgi:hypothetical protein